MLDWLKRKPATAPAEQPLDNEDQKPLTDERLERMLGRLGSDSRAPREPLAEVLDKPSPSSDTLAAGEAAAEARSEIVQPLETDSKPAEEPAAAPSEVPAPGSADSTADDGPILRRDDRTIMQRGAGPSAAELLAKGYSFATGPDGKMVIFDAEGRLTDVTLPVPSADGSAAGQPAAKLAEEIGSRPSTESTEASAPPIAAAVDEIVPQPSAENSEASAPVAEAVSETAPPRSTESLEASVPVAEAVSEAAPQPSTESLEASGPVAEVVRETAPPPRTRKRTARAPAAEAPPEIAVPPTGGKVAGMPAGGFLQMRVIAVASQKGGSGKTTIAAHLAVRADMVGQGPVVLIDTDPQGSLAEWWRARAEDTPQLASVRPGSACRQPCRAAQLRNRPRGNRHAAGAHRVYRAGNRDGRPDPDPGTAEPARFARCRWYRRAGAKGGKAVYVHRQQRLTPRQHHRASSRGAL